MTNEIKEYLSNLDNEINYITDKIEERKTDISRLIVEASLLQYKQENIKAFLSKPFVTIPKGHNQWYVIIPKFVDLQVGWLLKQTDSFNVFVVDTFSNWLYGIPQAIKDALDFIEPIPVTVQGDFVRVDPTHQNEVFSKYKKFLNRRDGTGTIKIRPRSRFSLIASLVKDGILPFVPQEVSSEDIQERPIKIELRDYQKEALDKFLRYGSVGVYWMPAGGKTIIGLFIMNMLRGKKLIVVPTRTLIEQWNERIRKYTTIMPSEYDIITYNSAHKVMKKEYMFTIFDECHHLPANAFSRLALIRTKYRMGLSATPYREDGRHELIFSLTGYPIGLDWKNLIDLQIVKKPQVRVILTANDSGKLTILDELVRNGSSKKTMIFCDSISSGQRLAVRYGLKFIHGSSKDRLVTIMKEKTIIISRVGDEGISLENLERVIEFAFLFGSRRQELQRLGRLFHSSFSGEHIILMTKEEFGAYRKRLFSLYEKGIDVSIEES